MIHDITFDNYEKDTKEKIENFKPGQRIYKFNDRWLLVLKNLRENEKFQNKSVETLHAMLVSSFPIIEDVYKKIWENRVLQQIQDTPIPAIDFNLLLQTILVKLTHLIENGNEPHTFKPVIRDNVEKYFNECITEKIMSV